MQKTTTPAAFLAVAALCACTVPPAPSSPRTLDLTPASFTDLPGWQSDHTAALVPALKAQCRRLSLMPAETDLGGQGLSATYGGRAGQWQATCRAAVDLEQDDTAARAFFTSRFQVYRIGVPALVTGYFEPEAAGSLQQGGAYQTPLLARPSDLVKAAPAANDPLAPPIIGRSDGQHIIPYWTRADIEAGAIGAQARPLFWLRNPADLFFLQIQGSGRIRLPDGAVVRVAYDGRNGRPYTPIGRVLIEEHALAPEAVSMQTIRGWLDSHPDQAKRIMDRNEDYVFFRAAPNADNDFGPPGAMGVNLTAGRSAAVDRHFVPLGAPVFIDTTDPTTNTPLRRLVLAQDIGTDITGPARTDLFLGTGDSAARTAGLMHQPGTEFVLLPRP